ncbi:MAG: hypothetical protein WCG12_12595 [Alcaligenaceae bacterium]
MLTVDAIQTAVREYYAIARVANKKSTITEPSDGRHILLTLTQSVFKNE